MTTPRAADPVEAVFGEEWGRLLATLVRWLGGDLDLAEEVAPDAVATAVERWPQDGVPDQPRAWLLTAARRKAIDVLRRRRKIRQAHIPYRIPGRAELPERLQAVLHVIYVVFTEAYAASRGPELMRAQIATRRSASRASCTACCQTSARAPACLPCCC